MMAFWFMPINGLVDNWLVSSEIIRNTQSLIPLIAVQPAYMHPYTAAKKIATYGYLYGRPIYLNMIAGGFRNDLLALNDHTPHDDRYKRLTEYTLIIRQLLESCEPLTFEGDYYKVSNLKMTPSLPAELMPGILMSGSSEAGQQAAQTIGTTSIKYPQRPCDEVELDHDDSVNYGIRVGIIARDTNEQAWKVAHDRFPPDRKGSVTHQLAMKVSDSKWHEQLSGMAQQDGDLDDPYWLGPFETYKTFCPYLVGTYQRVAQELRRYVNFGYQTLILDIPPSEEELQHTSAVLREATEASVQCQI